MIRKLGVTILAVILFGFSAGVVAATDITITAKPPPFEPIVSNNAATNITDVAATLHGNITDIGGSNVTARGFLWGYASGNYTDNWTESGNVTVGPYDYTVSNLTVDIEVFWVAYAVNGNGTGYSPELNFYTVGLPLPPADFTITEVGDTIVSITWTMGARANTTIIRASSTGYPSTVASGYLVYSGNETTVTISGLNLQTTTYYYRAWSENSYGQSRTYAQNYAGKPISIIAIVFVIALCGFALWKKGWIRSLLSLCIIIWGAFAMGYDIKIAAPLLALGSLLFFMGILKIMKEGLPET